MLQSDDFTPEQAQFMLEHYGERLPPDFKAFCLCTLGRFEEALPLLERALENEPRGWHLWFSKGFALLSLERYAEAVLAFKRALELNPGHEGSLRGRAEAMQALRAAQRTSSREEILMALYRWLNIPFPSVSLGQRFLERYPELLEPPVQVLIERIYQDLDIPGSFIWETIDEEAEGAEEKHTLMRERLELLRDIHRRGRTAQAIRDAHIDIYGGIALDMPEWLEQATEELKRLVLGELSGKELQRLGIGGLSEDTLQKKVNVHRQILARAERDPDIPPEMLAELRFFLQETLENMENADNPETQEERIACLEQALSVYTRERYPRRYAEIQHVLGLIYKHRLTGDPWQNLDEAIACYKRALSINTPEAFPKDHAMNQYNLGIILMLAYIGRSEEEQKKLREEAIACFQDAAQYFTRDRSPFEYARVQKSLGLVYSDYKESGQYVYVERTLDYLHLALEIFTPTQYPIEYAEVHSLLALFYKERVERDRVNILEKAFLSCEAALSVYTPVRFPREYAKTQQILGDLYLERIAGKRETNVDEAIACYARALKIFTQERDPKEHSETLNLLGNAYRERIVGMRQDNQEQALVYYKRALDIYHQQGDERGVAKMHYNLAIAYDERIAGSRRENQEQAFAYCLRALEVYTRERFPKDYAQTQSVLGSLYKACILGDRRANLEEAIRCYQRALEIYTPTRFPTDYAGTQHNLGNAYIDRIAGIPRENKEKAIACYRNALQFFTKDDFPVPFAAAHIQLGIAYRERIAGDQRANKEEAITHLEQALEIFTYEGSPREYAKAHHNLANVYLHRVAGTREQNQEAAIAHYTEGLKVTTLQDYPEDYAMTQDSLGVVYSQRIAGDRRANLEEALTYHQRALQVFTLEADPVSYARVMTNLGVTYWQRKAGDRRSNLDEAIACFKAALEIFTQEASPFDYAILQRNLGSVYFMQVGGERRFYLEQAIECFEKALHILTQENDPVAYATTQNNLGAAYQERVVGPHWENIERAIACHTSALQVLTREETPLEYAGAQNNLGGCYMERRLEGRAENIERAIACFQEALVAYATDPASFEAAGVLVNLGTAYSSRWEGEQRANLEVALNYYKQAESILERDPLTLEYALLQSNVGTAYAKRIEGEKQFNQAQALACCKRALQVFTLEGSPRRYRDVQLNLALIEEVRRNWQGAHEAYQNALAAEDLLVALGMGVAGQDLILREGRDPAIQNGYALTRLGRLGEAAVSFERGRARGLVEAMALRAASPEAIRNLDLRARYEKARRDLMSVQGIANISSSRHFNVGQIFGFIPGLQGESGERRLDIIFTEEYQKILGEFQATLQEVQAEQGSLEALNTRVDEATLLKAAQNCGPGHTIVYLTATSSGGVAVAALSGNPAQQTQARFASLDLPELTQGLLDDLLEDRLLVEKLPVSNSYGAAQSGIGSGWFLANWEGKTFRERAMALHTACLAEEVVCTFDRAAQRTVQAPWLAGLVDAPLDEMLSANYRKLTHTMDDYLLQEELRRCLDILEATAIRPLVAWLQEEKVTSCILIPCGALVAFPLQAAEIRPGETLADIIVTSVAPNARSLLTESRQLTQESAVYALGDPRPTRQKLELGEAEAWTLAALAQKRGLQGYVKVQEEATREAFAQAVEQGYVVDASCHARFDFLSPLDSVLILAQREYVLLHELLSPTIAMPELHPHNINMRGLRLLILSACQSAIVDLRGATNEVHSLTAGMIQAGAKAILAALWSVDDMATYLLIVRFMQEWLPRIEQEPPAAALTRAQRWLRNVTARELRTWRELSLQAHRTNGADSAGRRLEVQNGSPLSRVSKRADRYDTERAREAILKKARSYADPETRPYEDPIYWAGFQVTGW